MPQKIKTYLISGRITDKKNNPLPDLTVRALDAEPGNGATPSGKEIVTNAEGKYSLTCTDADFKKLQVKDGEAEIYICIYQQDKLLGKDKAKCKPDKQVIVDMKIDDKDHHHEHCDDDDDDDHHHHCPKPNEDTLAVSGVIRNESGELMHDIAIEVFDRDMRTEQSLGKTKSNKGKYSIQYKKEQFSIPEKGSADIIVKAYDTKGGILFKTPVYFNAPAQLEVNINLSNVEYKGATEWEVLTGLFTPLLGGIAPLELKEDALYQDISFIAGETGHTQHLVATWVAAFHLAERTVRWQLPVEAAVLFGCMRQGQPGMLTDALLLDLLDKDKSEPVKDKILKALVNISAELLQEILLKAFTENYTPVKYKKGTAGILDAFHQIKLHYAADENVGGGKGSVSELIQLTPAVAQEQTKFMTAYAGHDGSLKDLWKKLEDDKVFEQKDIESLRLSFDLGALTRNHVPMVAALHENISSGTTAAKRDFARYDQAEWLEVIRSTGPDGKPVGYPANMDGQTTEEKEQFFAAILEKSFERNYPTTAFAGNFTRAKMKMQAAAAAGKMPDNGPKMLPRDSDIDIILRELPDLELENDRIDVIVGEHPEVVVQLPDPPGTIAALKSIQRVFKLNPTFRSVTAVMDVNLDSAQQIYFMGLQQFMSLMQQRNINAIESKKIFQKAENAYALALSFYGTYNRAVNGAIPAMVPSPLPGVTSQPGFSLVSALQDKIAELPDLGSLFGSQHYCACSECRSVYSAAAHYVDILRFLKERNTHGTGIHAGKKVKDVLLERRPDLGEMELSCDNTNTALPYIDLVNEILEDAVQQPVAVKINTNAVLTPGVISTEIKKAMHTAGLPVADTATVYAPDSRNTWAVRDSHHAYKAFVSADGIRMQPTRQTHLSPAELLAHPEYTNLPAYHTLAKEVFPFSLPFNLWLVQSRAYLEHLGVSQPQLLELFGHTPASGEMKTDTLAAGIAWLGLSATEGQIITDTLPDKMPWDFWGLKEAGNNIPHPATPADTSTNLTGTWTEILTSMPVMLHRSGLKYEELLQLLQLRFVNPAGNIVVTGTEANNVCDVNRLSLSGLDAPALSRIHRFIRLWRKTGCTMHLLDMALPDINPGNPSQGKELTDSVIQQLAGISRISREFKLEWQEALALYNDIDHTVYATGVPGVTPMPTRYQQLFRNKLVDAVAVFPENPADIRGEVQLFIPGILAALGITEQELILLLADIDLSAISPLDMATLSSLYRLTILAGMTGLSIPEMLRLKSLWGEDPFSDPAATLSFVALSGKIKNAGFTIAETDYLIAHQTILRKETGLGEKEIVLQLQVLREAMQKITDDTALKSVAERKALLEAFVRQQLADIFRISMAHMEQLLSQVILPGTTGVLLAAFTDSRLLEKQPDGKYLELSESNFATLYKCLRLLHKHALIISRLKMKPEELDWWLQGTHAGDMEWLHPATLPTDEGGTAVFEQWMRLTDFFTWKRNLLAPALTAFEWLDILLSGQNEDAVITEMATLTGWEMTDINSCITAFGWNLLQDLKVPANLLRLSACMQVINRVGVRAERVLSWAVPAPDAAVAESMKQTIKARYTLQQWQDVIKPLQDIFREQKRNALVSWLLTHPDQSKGQYWTNEHGLYNHFLIDVEMGHCMRTSRLKQAVAAAQLFVQRCLLNLETDIIANTDTDARWKQWKWMKYYRVWEANRKVFLYPENWLEPELRDEKSPFFRELENELMQNDVDNDNATQAYLNYLEKLDKVANLETRAIYNEVNIGDQSALHVFARTRSSLAPEYYYRKRINGGRWLPWEKIDADITGNHLMAGVHNKRLFLLWPQFLEKATAPDTVPIPKLDKDYQLPAATKYWDINLCWSELKKGKWTPKTVSDTTVSLKQSDLGGDFRENIAFRTRIMQGIDVRMFSNKPQLALRGNTGFGMSGKQILPLNQQQEYLIGAHESTFRNNLLQHHSGVYNFYFTSLEADKSAAEVLAYAAQDSFKLLNSIKPGASFTVIDAKAAAFSEFGSFFFWDARRNYLVDYYASNWQQQHSYEWQYYQDGAFLFQIHYHPFAELFIKELNAGGIKGLLNRRIQIAPHTIPDSPLPFKFADYYKPTHLVTPNYRLPDKTMSFPVEDVDFSYRGAYASYNWELFFHAPFYIANKLAANQQFEEALEWYHYIFNPANTDNTIADKKTPQQKFWITKPFYETTRADYYKERIENLMQAIARNDLEGMMQVSEWRDNPFNPHLVARMRTVAYQKNVLMKYIQTIIAWADQLFRRNTIESVNEATQLYILADAILGPRPVSIPAKTGSPVKTWYQLEKDGVDNFGNALAEVENLLPTVPAAGTPEEDRPELPRLDVLYFGIPHNEKLTAMWDTVADRLYKIRHCMNYDGQTQQLPLFDPPIDPAMLIRAGAAGLEPGSVPGALQAPLPFYRFSFMLPRALDLCNEVRSLGGAMLSALEKKDAESFTLLRAGHERNMQDAVRLVKVKQLEEAQRNLEGLREARKITTERKDYYTRLVNEGWKDGEKMAYGLSVASTVIDAAVAAGFVTSGGLKLIPSFLAGSAGFGGTPTVQVKFGGNEIGNGAEMAVRTLQTIGATLDKTAGLMLTAAGYERRAEEWGLQQRLAELELPQMDKQIAAAEIRCSMAEQELVNHDKQKLNMEKEEEFMHSRFTNRELYDWMGSQLSAVYFQSYQLASDMARRTEMCYRYELGLSDSNYVQPGYWDSLKKGLLCGEHLYHDLKRLETAYYEQNRRQHELSKHVSLSLLDPVALLKLKQEGACFVNIPEALFDMDYPGHYFRRIKTLSISIPCISGPYTTIACTLTQTGNQLRKDATLSGNGKYARDLTTPDPRFRDEVASHQTITTSSAQNDHGLFELSFGDERYLPFEGTGAVSSWHIKLNKDCKQFDFDTIADLIFHFRYTARDGGVELRQYAAAELPEQLNQLALAASNTGLFRVLDIQQEFPDQWHQFLHPAAGNDQVLKLDTLLQRLPYFTRAFPQKKAARIEVVAQMKDNDKVYKVMLSPAGVNPTDWLDMKADKVYGGLHRAVKAFDKGAAVPKESWTIKLKATDAPDFRSLPADAIASLFLIINYSIT
ncbi:neuraminidase-like domain-containing protein [Chitinophaga solisilvae]|uniref:Tc toxin subunit A-related protein n=1 Tax=Chitinophaga solisilvae TaxID=1233460 RepID=UPI001369DC8A|nr:neuraminidase-like domain-containing protein [Chitinophaga solisilvae]